MILNDITIKDLSLTKGMIKPYSSKLTDKGRLSFGQSSFGYDVRLSKDVRIMIDDDLANTSAIDPKGMLHHDFKNLKTHTNPKGDIYVIIPPLTYALGHTVEEFDIPKDVSVVAVGKSTYARAGLIINTTPIEAGFKGTVVIELFNATKRPMRVYVNEGISQFLFFRGNECGVGYGERGGKYQNQQGIVLGKVL